MGFTKYPLKWKDKEKDNDRWNACFHNGYRLQPIVMASDGRMKKARENGGFMRFKVDFDKNQCIVSAYNAKNKKQPSAFAGKGEETFEIPKDVEDIIPAMSSRNSHIIEIRLGPVEYRR